MGTDYMIKLTVLCQFLYKNVIHTSQGILFALTCMHDLKNDCHDLITVGYSL